MENGKIWSSADAKPLNRSSPNLKHVITSQVSSSKKIWAQSAQGGFDPHIREIYAQNLQMFTSFFRFIRAPRDEPVGPIFVLNTSYDAVLRKEVPFRGEKIRNLTDLFEKFEKFIMAPMGKFWKNFNVITPVVCKIDSWFSVLRCGFRGRPI